METGWIDSIVLAIVVASLGWACVVASRKENVGFVCVLLFGSVKEGLMGKKLFFGDRKCQSTFSLQKFCKEGPPKQERSFTKRRIFFIVTKNGLCDIVSELVLGQCTVGIENNELVPVH